MCTVDKMCIAIERKISLDPRNKLGSIVVAKGKNLPIVETRGNRGECFAKFLFNICTERIILPTID